MAPKNRAASPGNRKSEDESAKPKEATATDKKKSLFGLPLVLSAEGLDHVATHKYVPGKYTPLDNLLNPFWLKVANSLPMWLAPNLVTMLGFVPLMCSFGLIWYCSPHFSEPPPRWLALTMGLTTFAYQTLDAVDGKQARRTGSANPLGQLFDHGCDCLTCMPIHAVATVMTLPGPSLWTVAGLATLQTGFFFAQWQEYHTGILRTSFGPVGVTETQWTLMVSCMIAFVAGPDAMLKWATTRRAVPGFKEPLPNGQVFIICWSLFVAVLVVISLAKTFKTIAKEKGSKALVAAVKQLIPITAINFSLFFIWDSAVVSNMPRKLCFMSGILFFYYTAQIILFSMSKMDYPIFQLETLPAYMALAVASRFLPIGLLNIVMGAASVLLTAWILLWLYRVLEELKTKLGIRTFRIKQKVEEEKSK